MKYSFLTAASFVIGLAMTTSVEAAQIFRSNINGSNILPTPTSSTTTGFANLSLNDEQTELAYQIVINGLALDSVPGGTVDRIHFHLGRRNEFSPFHVFNIYGPEDDADAIIQSTSEQIIAEGIWDDSDACTEINCESDPNSSKALSAYLDELLSNGIYINIHTTTFPGGEIRGQIESVPESSSLLALVGISSLIGLRYPKNK